MDNQDRETLKALLEQALALPSDERKAFLDQACRNDAALRGELDSLLAHYDEAPAFFESLAGAVLPQAQADEPPAPPERDPSRLVGRTVSRYQIEEKLGGGGMGVVYKARDLKLKRTVALKFLPPELTRDEQAKQRFMHEAQAASALDHVNVGYIHEIDETEDGRLFIAMAYYAGETLKKKIARGPLPVYEALDYAVQVARGLAKAHEAGIVHRDVKPANVMVTEEGVVKIVDFGLAKVAEQTQLTKTGTTLGTVAYMSPEQARGEPVDTRTDLWLLGVVLYEMLTGERPFRGDYSEAVIYSILNEDPAPITTLCPEAPEPLARVVEKLLSKDAAERYQWVEDLLPDLKVFRSAGSQSVSAQAMEAPVVPSIWRFVTIGIPVILLLLGGLWALSRVGSEPDEPATPVARTAIAVLPFTVRGDEDLAWLREGMVDLLATKLDGAGELRGIDPNALLGYLARNPDLILDPEGGREVAEHFGAIQYILGTVLNTGSERQINARLYDANGSEIMRTQATFVQNEELMPAVDRLASDLLANQLEDPSQQLSSLASGTTASFEALKAYVEGEQALRQARLRDAEAAALKALAIDSTFALAWYLLNRAQASRIYVSTKALEQAVRYKDSVSDRARMLIEAVVFRDEGQALEAEQIYRGLVTRYPDDIEAWGMLGDSYYHNNPLRGRPASQARDAFERVLFYDPDNRENLNHLFLLLFKEGDDAAVDSLAAQFLGPDAPQSTADLLYALIRASDEERAQRLAGLADVRRGELSWGIMAWARLLEAEQIDLADQVICGYVEVAKNEADRMIARRRRMIARNACGITRLAQGQWHAGRDDLRNTPPPFAGNALVNEVFSAMLPFAQDTAESLDALQQRVADWDTTAAPYQTSTQWDYANRHAILKAFMQGLLAWRAGDDEVMRRFRDVLNERASPEGANTLAYSFARTLDALSAWRAGQPESALRALDEVTLVRNWNEAFLSIFAHQGLNRFVRAEILNEQGRLEDALPWYASMLDGFHFQGLMWLGPSYLRRAEIYDELGYTDNAILFYERFVDLWKDADPDLQSEWVEPARQQLERLLEDVAREPGEVVRPGSSS